jgi:hypothetical protein
MNVELLPALAGGLLGGVVMAVLQLLLAPTRWAGFDLLNMWARFVGFDGQRAVGLVVHLAVSAAVAVVYAIGFSVAGASDAGWAWGLAGAIIHWIVGGLFLAAVPADEKQNVRRLGRSGSGSAHLSRARSLPGTWHSA